MTQPNEKDRERARGVALELNMCCSNLEAELKKAEGAIRTHADSINVLMKEKAGLEERVRELEGDKNILELQVSAKRETWESQTVDRLEKKLEYYQSQFNHYHTLAEKVTLKNERLKAKLHEANLRASEYKTEWESAPYREQGLKSRNKELEAELQATRKACDQAHQNTLDRDEEIDRLKAKNERLALKAKNERLAWRRTKQC